MRSLALAATAGMLACVSVIADEPKPEWTRCGGATLSAHAEGGKPTLIAEGTVPTGGWREKLQMSPELIQPPRYELLCLRPTGIVSQVVTHYRTTLALSTNTKDGDVTGVYDAAGLHMVTYKAAH